MMSQRKILQNYLNENQTIQQPLKLSITSRGIGMSTAQLTYVVKRLSFLEYVSIPDIYARYRVYLALFEGKLMHSGARYTLGCKIGYELREKFLFFANALSNTPMLIKRIIDAIGVVKHEGKEHIPAVAKLCRDAEKKLLPRPETTLLSNLRETVIALASPDTPLDIRSGYEQNCAIPGAIWQDHILKNPDEIMPENYSYCNGLNKDIFNILIYFENLKRHAPDMFGDCLSLSTDGRKSVFVSNKMETLRCPNRYLDEELNHYYARCIADGNIEEYLSLYKITPEEEQEGQIILLGELPNLEGLICPIYILRHKAAQPYYMNSHYYEFSFLGIYVTKQINLGNLLSCPLELTISVTSRGIGLCTAYFVYTTYQKGVKPERIPDIYAQYRVYLALFEARLNYTSNTPNYCTRFNNYDVAHGITFAPSPVSGIVGAIGRVEHNGKTYIPAVAELCRDVENNLQPRPETTLLSNLRETVDALTRDSTPLNIRSDYELYCPIPGAIWQDHILQNPDEIIPENYDSEGLKRDVNMILSCMSHLVQYISLPQISYNNKKGKKSIFVSNEMTFRCQNRNPDEKLESYYTRCIPQENGITNYSSVHKLTHKEQLEGQAYLLGEIPKIKNVIHPVYIFRHKAVHAYSIHSNYTHTCRVLYE